MRAYLIFSHVSLSMTFYTVEIKRYNGYIESPFSIIEFHFIQNNTGSQNSKNKITIISHVIRNCILVIRGISMV